ncbi:hypothetical protein M9H77_27188 [Catharanthus roseus]|uniref:Uncharacterized protein n=1 Tax=Catharanthus roseus TaxID=4058 RepID=A0ACC0ADF1_CATRO|nr:hypothetical protein M9H77_27188 [Catharanthus roseus]
MQLLKWLISSEGTRSSYHSTPHSVLKSDNIIRILVDRTLSSKAKWYFSGYTPTLEEYLNNAWISIGALVILVNAYFLVRNSIKKEALECLFLDNKYHNIIRCSSMILCLAVDLGTSSREIKLGDVPKLIRCYMKKTGASEEQPREYIRLLISEAWKEINKVVRETDFSRTFIGVAMNRGRMAVYVPKWGFFAIFNNFLKNSH